MRLILTVGLLELITWSVNGQKPNAIPKPDTTIRGTITVLSSKIDKIDSDFDVSSLSSFQTLDEINKEVTNLLLKTSLTPTEVKNLSVLINRKAFKEDDLRLSERLNNVTKLEERYDAGLTILKTMIGQLTHLRSKYKDLKLYKNYSVITNPLSYREFKDNQTQIDNKLGTKKFKITLPVPLDDVINKNPSIAMGYSLATSILSNFPQADKSEKFKTIRNVLSVTYSMQNDLNHINSEIDYLDSRVEGFLERKCKGFFSDYLKVIGYDKKYADYLEDKQRDQTISTNKAQTFSTIKTDITKNKISYILFSSTTEKETEVTFNLIRLVDLINEYKTLLNETYNYYDTFDKAIKKYSNKVDYPELNFNPTMTDGVKFQEKIASLTGDLKTAKDAADDAYKVSDISEFEIRTILYGRKN